MEWPNIKEKIMAQCFGFFLPEKVTSDGKNDLDIVISFEVKNGFHLLCWSK